MFVAVGDKNSRDIRRENSGEFLRETTYPLPSSRQSRRPRLSSLHEQRPLDPENCRRSLPTVRLTLRRSCSAPTLRRTVPALEPRLRIQETVAKARPFYVGKIRIERD